MCEFSVREGTEDNQEDHNCSSAKYNKLSSNGFQMNRVHRHLKMILLTFLRMSVMHMMNHIIHDHMRLIQLVQRPQPIIQTL